jgi:signal transduction histidine kinase
MGTTVSPKVGSKVDAKAPSRTTVAVLAVGGVLAGVILIELAINGAEVDQPGLRASLACWVTLPYIGAGLIAWRRRPESRLGVLMVIAGFTTFLNFLNWSDNDLLFTMAMLVNLLPPVMFLHVFLAFPSGRLHTQLERVVVGAAYTAAALALPILLLGAEPPRNVIALTDNPAVREAINNTQHIMISLVSLTGIGLLVRRRIRNGPPLRVTMTLLVDAFAAGLLMLALLPVVALWLPDIVEPIRLTTFIIIGLAPIVFLAGLLQARLGRASVGELMVSLGVNPGPGELHLAVAQALRDPSVRLAYWLPEFDSYADVDGRQMELQDEAGRSATPVTRDGVPVAMLLHDSALDDEPALMTSVAAAIGMCIENAQLQVELRARLEELRGSRARILGAEQRERRRLERDLHDGAQQRLVSLSLELGELTAKTEADPELRKRLETARREVTASLSELRDLARGIHPAAVSDYGLSVALESVATRAPLPVELIGVGGDRLPEPIELAAFYIVCEALANVAKHSNATSAVVSLTRESSWVSVEVTDDGMGGASAEKGTGLRGLADRVEAVGGRLQVWSPTGGGTRLRAELPCE